MTDKPEGPRPSPAPEPAPAPYPAPAPAPRRRERPAQGSKAGAAVIVIFLLMALFGGFCLILTLAASAGGGGGGSAFASSTRRINLREQTLYGSDRRNRILVVEVEGAIMKGSTGGLFTPPDMPDMIELITHSLERARDDKTVKAVLLRIDSPGGGVTASDEIYAAIREFRETKKPIYVSMGGLCASGGYYIAAPCDRIFAQPTTITGSIGVILSGLNYSEMLKKIGVRDVTVASGDNKALLSASQPVDEEHVKILRQTVDSMYQRFVGIVADGRGLSLEEIKEKSIADGRVFSATKARELKLVDEIGYQKDAVAALRKAISAPDARVFRYKREMGLLDALQASATAPRPSLLFDPERLRGRGPRLLYLWKP